MIRPKDYSSNLENHQRQSSTALPQVNLDLTSYRFSGTVKTTFLSRNYFIYTAQQNIDAWSQKPWSRKR